VCNTRQRKAPKAPDLLYLCSSSGCHCLVRGAVHSHSCPRQLRISDNATPPRTTASIAPRADATRVENHGGVRYSCGTARAAASRSRKDRHRYRALPHNGSAVYDHIPHQRRVASREKKRERIDRHDLVAIKRVQVDRYEIGVPPRERRCCDQNGSTGAASAERMSQLSRDMPTEPNDETAGRA
jgi:hypothetical protein